MADRAAVGVVSGVESGRTVVEGGIAEVVAGTSDDGTPGINNNTTVTAMGEAIIRGEYRKLLLILQTQCIDFLLHGKGRLFFICQFMTRNVSSL